MVAVVRPRAEISVGTDEQQARVDMRSAPSSLLDPSKSSTAGALVRCRGWGTVPPATIRLLMEGEVATERGRGAVGAPAAACRRIAGSGPLHVLIFAVMVANAIALGLGTYALGRAADSAVLVLEGVILGIFV
jgi:hypothetical protein